MMKKKREKKPKKVLAVILYKIHSRQSQRLSQTGTSLKKKESLMMTKLKTQISEDFQQEKKILMVQIS